MTQAKQLLRSYFSLFVIILFLVPFLGATHLLLNESRADILFTEKELVANRYNRALYTTFSALHAHIHATISPNDHPDNHSSQAVKTALAEVDALEEDAAFLQVSTQWETTKASILSALKTPASQRSKLLQRFTEASTALHDLFSAVAINGNLILDPEVESYYLATALINSLPDTGHELHILFSTTPAQHHGFERQIGRIENILGNYQNTVNLLSHHDPEKVAQETETNWQSVTKTLA